jgi:predicted peptidase
MGESGIDGMKQVIQGLGSAIQWNVEAWPFIVVFPQKPDSRKQWEEYLTPVMAMLDQTKKDYSIDKARVYLTGLSQGGHGTWTFAAQRPDVWAAIAPVCGYAKPGEIAPKIKHLPVWAFHGDADSVVPAQQTRDMLAALRALGADPKESFYPGVNHNSWDKVYREENLAAWFLKHARNP